MRTPPVTVGWVLALLAFLCALGLIFVPTVVPFAHVAVGVGIGLVAASRLLP